MWLLKSAIASDLIKLLHYRERRSLWIRVGLKNVGEFDLTYLLIQVAFVDVPEKNKTTPMERDCRQREKSYYYLLSAVANFTLVITRQAATAASRAWPGAAETAHAAAASTAAI